MTDDGGPMAGRGEEATGRYSWSAATGALTFRVIADRDVGRLTIMGGGPMRRLTSPAPRPPQPATKRRPVP